MKVVLILVIIGGLAVIGVLGWKPANVSVASSVLSPVEPAAGHYRCDGRTMCSEMSSCAEATWFLKNCPGTKMDGNHDGVPCESQWCGR